MGVVEVRRLGLERDLIDRDVYERTVGRFRDAKIVLPTFSQLANPEKIPDRIREALATVEPDEPHPLNLFRVHWYNDASRTGITEVPEHVILPPALTGVDAKIVVAFGNRFPMIGAHKVLAAYGCLAPRVITGQFDPSTDRAIWPSTGNYCRGGVAISRIMQSHGVAVLPAGMSQERFDWLADWVLSPDDIIRTPGTESNVKEIYDKCNELSRDTKNVIFNQFSEFGNHLVHYLCTGSALERVFESVHAADPSLKLAAFTSATGSAGTIAAGDWLKERHGAKVVAVEAWECPTMLLNGFGEHNIQGIGDKHIPLIHNVMNTDLAVAVNDRSTDGIGVLWNTAAGREYLTDRRGVPAEIVGQLGDIGLSGVCNILAAIKTAKYYELGSSDVIVTVATDGYAMYQSEREKAVTKYFGGSFDAVNAGEVFGEHLLGETTDHMRELTYEDRMRVFNLGYFTWVEQQGVEIDEFRARKSPSFWTEIRDVIPVWDRMIEEFNAATGAIDQL
jgi:cysteine synthase A